MGVVFLKCCEKKQHHHYECSCVKSARAVVSPDMANGARKCVKNRVSPLMYWCYCDGR